MNSVRQAAARRNVAGLSGLFTGLLAAALQLAALAYSPAAVAEHAEADDPSGRVARLIFVEGQVDFAADGERDFSEASYNRPLVTGDRIATARRARAALDLGGAELRLDDDSELLIRNLDDRGTQLKVVAGSINLGVRALASDQSIEIDTPNLAMVITRPGQFRIDVDSRSGGATVSVFGGSATVYGENSARYEINARGSYHFIDPALAKVERSSLPRADAFDRWAAERDQRIARSTSERYASAEVVGVHALDDYGDWREERDYGPVWYPSRLAGDWAPYRFGHWIWLSPWGWTWIDDAPWGFAPFHYGRWVFLNDNWGWLPCRRDVRPVYAPALVAFVGNRNTRISIGINSGPVGWFPLGPRDVYVPPYRASGGYFGRVNNSNSTHLDAETIRRYEPEDRNRGNGRRGRGRQPAAPDYAYRSQPGAMTVVDAESFSRSRPVGEVWQRGRPQDLARAPILRGLPQPPSQEGERHNRVDGRVDGRGVGSGNGRGNGRGDERRLPPSSGAPIFGGAVPAPSPPQAQAPQWPGGNRGGQNPPQTGREPAPERGRRPPEDRGDFNRERPMPFPTRRYTPEEVQRAREGGQGRERGREQGGFGNNAGRPAAPPPAQLPIPTPMRPADPRPETPRPPPAAPPRAEPERPAAPPMQRAHSPLIEERHPFEPPAAQSGPAGDAANPDNRRRGREGRRGERSELE